MYLLNFLFLIVIVATNRCKTSDMSLHIRPSGYKIFIMLISTEHEYNHTHKC